MSPAGTSAMGSRLFGILLGAVAVVYPLVVYFFLDQYGVTTLAGFLIVVLLIRVVPLLRKRPLALIAVLAFSAAFIVTVYQTESVRMLMLYPTVINLTMLGVFAATLIYPPSMIERFSRMMKMEIPPPAIPYMKVVTVIWCGFFAMNTIVSSVLAVRGETAYWAWYNGLISYLIMGVLVIAEILFRQVYKRRHGLL